MSWSYSHVYLLKVVLISNIVLYKYIIIIIYMYSMQKIQVFINFKDSVARSFNSLLVVNGITTLPSRGGEGEGGGLKKGDCQPRFFCPEAWHSCSRAREWLEDQHLYEPVGVTQHHVNTSQDIQGHIKEALLYVSTTNCLKGQCHRKCVLDGHTGS
jgi:hypothetical protein